MEIPRPTTPVQYTILQIAFQFLISLAPMLAEIVSEEELQVPSESINVLTVTYAYYTLPNISYYNLSDY